MASGVKTHPFATAGCVACSFVPALSALKAIPAPSPAATNKASRRVMTDCSLFLLMPFLQSVFHPPRGPAHTGDQPPYQSPASSAKVTVGPLAPLAPPCPADPARVGSCRFTNAVIGDKIGTTRPRV